MAGLSKYFNEMVKGHTCQDMIHPWTSSCPSAFWGFLKNYSFDGVKFFAPAVFIGLIMKTKSDYIGAIGRGLLDVAKCSVVGHVSYAMAMSYSCLLHKLCGGYSFFTYVFWPTFLGAFLVYKLPHHAQVGHAHPFACVFLEVMIKFSDNPIIRWLRRSLSVGTIAFMIFSGGILHYIRKHGASVFWFILPQRPATNNENNSCDHKNKTCQRFFLEGVKQYVIYGLILEVVKNLFSRFPLIKKQPSRILYHLIANPNFKFLKFFVTYVGLFRGVTCLVNNFWTPARDYSTLIGGMAGGLSYIFFPNYNLFTSAMVTLLQVYWTDLLKQRQCPKSIHQINRLPLAVFFYAIFIAFSCQVQMFYPVVAPSFSYRTIKANSSGAVDILKWAHAKVLFKPFAEFIN